MSGFSAVGIGNAVVDVIGHCDDAFLERAEIQKGVMQLIDRERAEFLYDSMAERTQMAGGSVANTISGLGALGLNAAFIGRVRDDALGRDYVRDMAESGARFAGTPVRDAELPTSRSMIFATPDGQRSMNTYLGISTELGPDDVDESVAGGADLLLLEGYLFDKARSKEAFLHAARACRAGGGRAGIALSDPMCVERHRDDFLGLVRELDYAIGNWLEWQALYQTDDLACAMERAAADCGLVACTHEAQDVILIGDGARVSVPVDRIDPVDVTGAGDQFAAGFLYGVANGLDLAVSGKMGCIAAREVIGHFGARPQTNVMKMFRAEGLA